MMKIVCVKVCGVIEAQAGKALLESNGIRAEITPYSEAAVSAVAGGVGAMGILVREADVQAAFALLETEEYEVAPRFVEQQARSPRLPPPSPEEREQAAAQGLRQMGRGLVRIALGAALTVGAGWLARQGTTGFSVIFYGLVVWGLIEFGAGLANWWKNRD